MPAHILSFHTYMCTKNEDHMIYGSWNVRCTRQKFLPIWAILCPFSPLTTCNIKILTLKKAPWDIIILHIYTINEAPQTEFFVILACSLPFYPPYRPRKSKFLKYDKNTERYHFTNVCHNWQSYDVLFLRYGVQQIEFFVILDCFLLFYPEKSTFWKNELNAWRYIILQMRTKKMTIIW